MNRWCLLFLTPLLMLGWVPSASAQEPDAQEIIAQVDAVSSLAQDFQAKLELVTVEDGEETARSLQIWQKGPERRMLKISAPARLKGVGMLVNEGDVFHIYLPAFEKIRRVAGRDRGQSFFGSNFSQDDMARTQYGARYSPSLVGGDEEVWILRLDPKEPDDEPHHHLIMDVRKADHLVSRIEFFAEEGGPAERRISAGRFEVVGALPLAFEVVAEDLESGSRSTATLSDVQVDVGLEDGFFSKRQLKRKP